MNVQARYPVVKIKNQYLYFIVLEEYRWWVGLWSDSDGSVKLEIPSKWIGQFAFFGHVVDGGYLLHIYNSPIEQKGTFSKLSKNTEIGDIVWFFDGKCERIK